MKKVIYLGFTYASVFTGYYVISGFLNIVYPKEAFIGFAIFYGVYALGSIFSPYFFKILGMRLALILASITFLIFVAFASSKISVLMLVGSGIGGLGNSVIWLSQGVYISTQEGNQSKLMGIFYAIFNINMFIGNLVGLIILVTGVDVIIMMWCMMIFAGVGVIMSIIFATFKTQVIDAKVEINIRSDLANVFTIAFNKQNKGYLLILMMMMQAIGLNVTYQVLPILLSNHGVRVGFIVNLYNAGMFIAYGISAIVFSYLWGLIFDKSWKYIVIPYCILELACLIGILILGIFGNDASLGCWIIFGFVRGITDYAVNNILNITISIYYKGEDNNGMFAFYRLIYAVSYVIFSICIGYIIIWAVLGIAIGFVILSVISYCIFQHLNNIPDIEKDFKKSEIKIKDIR